MSLENVSPNTLFHLTGTEDGFENFRSILASQKFVPSYSLENYRVMLRGTEDTYCAPPIVCFCNLRLTDMVKKHTDDFGEFGFGFNRRWGQNQGLSPVIYSYPGSNHSDPRSTSREFVRFLENVKDENPSEQMKQSMMRFFCFFKLYKEEDTNQENPIYYDEREWRFVPEIRENEELEQLIRGGEKDEVQEKVEGLKAIMWDQQHHHLDFDLSELKFLLVKNQDYLSRTIEFLEEKFEQSMVKKLTRKLVTIEEVESVY